MKVTFAGTTPKLEKYKENYTQINNLIKELGHELTRDWLEAALKHNENKQNHPVNWKEIFHETSKSVLACDVAIFECTQSSFSNGYLISLAMERRKPILILWHESSKRDLRDTFTAGIDSDLITIKKYNKENIKEILQEFFIRSENGGEKIRFNFYIDKNIENYLDWAAYHYKKSKADIIRETIHDRITHGDERYTKYTDKAE